MAANLRFAISSTATALSTEVTLWFACGHKDIRLEPRLLWDLLMRGETFGAPPMPQLVHFPSLNCPKCRETHPQDISGVIWQLVEKKSYELAELSEMIVVFHEIMQDRPTNHFTHFYTRLTAWVVAIGSRFTHHRGEEFITIASCLWGPKHMAPVKSCLKLATDFLNVVLAINELEVLHGIVGYPDSMGIIASRVIRLGILVERAGKCTMIDRLRTDMAKLTPLRYYAEESLRRKATEHELQQLESGCNDYERKLTTFFKSAKEVGKYYYLVHTCGMLFLHDGDGFRHSLKNLKNRTLQALDRLWDLQQPFAIATDIENRIEPPIIKTPLPEQNSELSA